MKLEFEIPSQLNGKQLTEELKTVGVEIEYMPKIEEGFLILHIKTGDVAQAQTVVDNHIAVFTEPTIADKLAAVGLTVEELREALGSN
jgi:hypothetical protein